MSILTQIIKYSLDLNLLYVEDHDDARESSMCIFEEFFENIVIGINGEDGLEKFNQNKIDIIITDINMPKMNGLEMISKIREIDKNVPILVLSAFNESGYFMESIRLGVEGYLLKPIEFDQFLGVLDKIVEKLKLKEEKKASDSFLEQYKEITDKSSNVSIINTDKIITYVNDQFCSLSGYTKDELIGQNYEQLQYIANDIIDPIKDKKQIWQGIIKNLTKDGDVYYLKTTIKPILDTNGEIIEYIAIGDDITEIMNHKKLLFDLIDRSKEPLVVLFKIDDFDNLIGFYGDKRASMIQEQFSNELLNYTPSQWAFDKVFILDNGEYAFVVDKEELYFDLEQIIGTLHQFQDNLNDAKIGFDHLEYDISVVISFAYGNNSLENAKLGLRELLNTKQNFILANGLAKKEYDQAKQNMKTLQVIKNALENDQIISYFQPIINNRTKQIEKYESLVRLVKEDGEIIAPYFFMDIAKKGKYYAQITAVVLENSFRALSYTHCNITINLSAIDIEKSSTRVKLFELLNLHKQNAHRIVFELLEDENVKDFEVIKKFIFDVKQFGVKIAIDDFGEGYSNMKRLLDYQPDILKIDGSLIKNIESDHLSLAIVKNIVDFAKKQQIQTVAEFVKNENIFNILNDIGVDYSQGYYFGKPAPLNK